MRSLIEDKPDEIAIPQTEYLSTCCRRFIALVQLPLTTRMRAAIAALPHEVPRLAVTAQVTDEGIAELLDRRLKRIEEMKLIEASGAKVIDAQPQPVETKPPPARTNDRRFRRF